MPEFDVKITKILWSRTKLAVLILSVLLVVSISLLIHQYTKSDPVHIDNTFLEEQIDKLELENAEIQNRVTERDEMISRRDQEIDSLKAYKPEIKIKYVKIYKEIDNSSAIRIAELSDSIYSAEGIGNRR